MNRRLSTVAVVAVLALTGCSDDAASPGAQPTATSSESSATPSASPSPTPDASPSAATVRVPVYYLGGTQARPVLYREFRSVPKPLDTISAAVEAMLHVAPQDSDYYSLWPAATTLKSVATSGTTATVDLSSDARSVTTSRVNEVASLQQLVHTVTAADTSIKTVALRFDGTTKPTLWGRVDTTTPLGRNASIDTIAPVWVIEPAPGSTVSRTFTVKGTAAVFEATVSWEVTRPGSTTQLAHGFVNASQGAPGRGDYTVSVTLPAGTTGDVVFTAWEDSAEDGSRLFPDSKTYRVS